MSKNLHELSDEELMALDPADLAEEQTPAEETEEQVEESQAAPEQTEQSESEVFDEETESTSDDTSDTTTEEVNEVEAAPNTSEEADTDVDYQGFYKAITSPFKANGKEIQITDPQDIISLMQQGANYSKKMQEIKPHQAIIKTLDQHGLLDVSEIGFLIDLKNKKPEAIAKLLKDSDIDLYSFDTDQAESYVPTNTVQEVSPFEETLNHLTDESPAFSQVLDSLVNQWDDVSKQQVYNNPQILEIMNQHAKDDVFGKVVGAIDYARMVGRIPQNMPFLQAYSMIEPQFVNAPQGTQNKAFTAPRPNQPKPIANNNNNKNKAAIPGSSGNNNNNNNVNPLAMSDEELLQYMHTQM